MFKELGREKESIVMINKRTREYEKYASIARVVAKFNFANAQMDSEVKVLHTLGDIIQLV